MRPDLVQTLLQLCSEENTFIEPMPGVDVFSCNSTVERCPFVYEPRICLIAQGSKRVYLGNRCYQYDANSYLLSSLTLPVEVEIELPDNAEPFVGLSLAVDRAMVRQLIMEIGQFDTQSREANNRDAMQSSPCTERLLDAVLRLLQTAHDPLEQAVLAPGIWREIYFEVLRGPNGAMLHNCLEADVEASRMAPVIHYIDAHYDQKLDIESLANIAHMSSSTLHEQFKQLTSLSPMQYIKNLRLHRAHTKILAGLAINQACYEVGYHSPSQFSREFKRFFGVSPREAAQTGYTESAYLS